MPRGFNVAPFSLVNSSQRFTDDAQDLHGIHVRLFESLSRHSDGFGDDEVGHLLFEQYRRGYEQLNDGLSATSNVMDDVGSSLHGVAKDYIRLEDELSKD